MSPATAHFFMWLSHVGWPILVPIGAVCGVALHLSGVRLARARAAGDHGGTSAALAVRRVSGVLLGATVLLFGAAFFHIGCAAEKGRSVACYSNVKELGRGLLMYGSDNDEAYPAAGRWEDAVRASLRSEATPAIFVCPNADPPAGYGMNARLLSTSMRTVEAPAGTVMLFETDARRPSFAGSARDVAKPRHSGMGTFGFADGHAKALPPRRLEASSWEPVRGTE